MKNWDKHTFSLVSNACSAASIFASESLASSLQKQGKRKQYIIKLNKRSNYKITTHKANHNMRIKAM